MSEGARALMDHRLFTTRFSGGNARRIPFGYVMLNAKAGEILRVAAADIYPKFDQNYQGIFVQASGGSVKVSTTLASLDIALDPEQDDGGDHWIVDTTAAPSSITKLKTITTALKLEFLGDAIIYIGGV